MTLKVLLVFIMALAQITMSQLLKDAFTSTVCAKSAGCMRGHLMKGYNSPSFEAFLGIPYALPPVGDLRFSNPKPFPKWNDTFNAFEAKSDCIQKNYLVPGYPTSGSEDCLYLNVYRPLPQKKSKKLPVMIYIFGGGWFSGTAHPDIVGPEYIMDTKKVILVTFSYRLGAFGFLSTGDVSMPGNFGLKDQVLAMKWVQNNIEAFGGDRKMVTLFGQSAGAISAHMHMLSPLSRGLFRGVIALSGTANWPFAINDDPLQQAIRVAKLCGIENAELLSSNELLRALRTVDKETLLKAGDGLKFWSVDHIINYRPVVESENDEHAFLTKHPEEIMKSGKYQPVPFMLGSVPQEGAVRGLAILESEDLRNSFNKDFFNILKTFLYFPKHFNEQQLNQKMHKIIEEYFQGQQELNYNTSQGFLDLITERGLSYPLYNTLKYYVKTINTKDYPIYLYTFNYTGPYSFSTLYTGGRSSRNYGVVHCDDLIYLFRSPLLFPDFPKFSEQAKAIQLFVKNIVRFAKSQKPLPTVSLRKCDSSTFQQMPETICDYQLFENKLNTSSIIIRSENKFRVNRMRFWDEILNK